MDIDCQAEYKWIKVIECIIYFIAGLWAASGIILTAYMASHWIVSFSLFWWLIITGLMFFNIFDIKERLQVKLFHLRLCLVGYKTLNTKGYATIPCKKCRNLFKSYAHYDGDEGYCYDAICKYCEEEGKNGYSR